MSFDDYQQLTANSAETVEMVKVEIVKDRRPALWVRLATFAAAGSLAILGRAKMQLMDHSTSNGD